MEQGDYGAGNYGYGYYGLGEEFLPVLELGGLARVSSLFGPVSLARVASDEIVFVTQTGSEIKLKVTRESSSSPTAISRIDWKNIGG